MLKRFLKIGLVCLVIACLWNCNSIIYGIRQGRGQLHILRNAKPIDEVLNNDSFPQAMKENIRLIEAIKKFSVDSLGILPSENYQKVYDQQGKPALYVVTACDPNDLIPYQWQFPIVGKVPYKGYFKEKYAVKTAESLKEKGYDTDIGHVNAWSTLGWFKDPIMSSMLEKSEGQIARVIIHELTHGTLFIKDNVTYNENLATFVGDKGAVLFLQHHFGPESQQLKDYLGYLQDMEKFQSHMIRGAKELQYYYDRKKEGPVKTTKREKIESIIQALDTIQLYKAGRLDKIIAKKSTLNNTFFTDFLVYREQQNQFEQEFEQKFNSDFKKYLTYLKATYGKK